MGGEDKTPARVDRGMYGWSVIEGAQGLAHVGGEGKGLARVGRGMYGWSVIEGCFYSL